MSNYYNEHDPKAAAWLRELIKQKLIPDGDVDERSITEIKPHELTKYTQCHFFAGIGGWNLALQLAGWPADKPVWTGSCPCQPFSAAGKGLGDKDERHLWPVFFDLIKECGPKRIFGEQVASAIGKGWLDGVSTDLESENYTCGAIVLGAHSVGAPHIRQRLYWMANSGSSQRETNGLPSEIHEVNATTRLSGVFSRLPDTMRQRQSSKRELERPSNTEKSEDWQEHRAVDASWSNYTVVPCRDGKSRRIESGITPLANGVPARVVRLRGYGNAIVPQVAAAFVRSFMDLEQDNQTPDWI